MNKMITRLNIKIVLIIITALMALQGYWFYRFVENIQTARFWSRHTYEVIIALKTLQRDYDQIKLNISGVLYTGDNNLIKINTNIISQLASLKSLIKSSSTQQQFDNLEPLLKQQLEQVSTIIENKANKKDSVTINILNTNPWLGIDSKIEEIINAMISTEQNRLQSRLQLNDEVRTNFYRFNFVAAILSYFVLVGLIILLMRSLNLQRKLQEDKINANARFKQIFDLSSDAHLIVDFDEGIIDCNNATLKMLRCSNKTQLIGRKLNEFSPIKQPGSLSPQDKKQQVEAEVKNKGHVEFEWILKRFDAMEIPIEVYLTLFELEQKEVIFAIWHDISEQKKYQNVLEQLHHINANKSLPLSNKIKQIITLGCQYFHLHNGIMGKVENDQYHALYTAQNVNSVRPGTYSLTQETKPLFNLTHFLALDSLPQKESLLLDGNPIRCYIGCPIYVNEKYYGTISYFKGAPRLEPFTKTEKSFIQLISQWIGNKIESNITLRELEESRKRFERATKSANEGLWEWNCITNKVFVNSRYEEMLGYGENECGDDLETFSQFIHPDDSKAVWDAVKKSMDDHVPFNQKFRMQKKDGSYIWVNSRGNVYRDQNEKPILMTGFIAEIKQQQGSSAKGET